SPSLVPRTMSKGNYSMAWPKPTAPSHLRQCSIRISRDCGHTECARAQPETGSPCGVLLRKRRAPSSVAPQHRLNFFPESHGHGSLRPMRIVLAAYQRTVVSVEGAAPTRAGACFVSVERLEDASENPSA